MSRCKPGELAIIIYDVPSCTLNIGRIVTVSGPPAFNPLGKLTWLIQPVTLEPFMINDRKGNFARFMDYMEDGIEHPDDWMTPIRPDDLDHDMDEQEDLTREREVVTCN